MNKNILSLLVIFCVTGCFFAGQKNAISTSNGGPCPSVVIRADNQAITQVDAYQKIFKIEMVGYDGYCLFDDRINKNKAFVAPKFKIMRLADSNVEDVHFSYYLETAEGPTSYLGRKTYYTSARIAKGVFETYHTATFGELSIPDRKGGVDIYAGLNAIRDELEFKN